MLTDTPLVKNLDNLEYLEIILDGCRDLEERSERIDSRLVTEKLKAEMERQKIGGAEMKKIIQLPDLPERLSTLLAKSQDWYQPSFALIVYDIDHQVSIEKPWNSFELVRFKKTLTWSGSNNGFNEMPKWGYGSCEEKYKTGTKAAGYL